MAAIAKSLIPQNLREPEPLQPIVLPESGASSIPNIPMRLLPSANMPQSLMLKPQMENLQVSEPSPLDQQIQHDQQKLQKIHFQQENPWGTANNHPGVGGKIAHVLSVAGNIAGDIFAPGVMARIPGTQMNRQVQEGDLNERLGKEVGQQSGQKLAEQEEASKAGLQAAQADYYAQHAGAVGVRPMTADEAASIGHPELTGRLMDQKSISTLIGKRDTNQTRENVANIGAISRETIAKLKPEQRDDRAIAINQKLAEGQPITPEETSYLKAYSKYIDQTKVQPGVARAQAFGMFRPVQALNPETGQPEWNWSGQAVGQHMGTTSNIPFRTAAGMAKFMTSGKGGQTITAYNTANDHLDLLGKAMDALDNGDVQALNQLNNSFKQQFGQAAPTNVNAVKAMLAGELANVAKVTGATDPEIQEQRENINRAASPEQIKGFIDTNHELMDQKAYEMYQQYQQGMQGKPAFSTGLTGRGPQNVAPEGGLVKLKAPDGTVQDVPAGQAEHFIKLGAQRVK
jgi:hypothetical protein